ncbi:conserved protein, unknown function [Plasmodium chabaudi chabaudi]|uniref:Hpc2-related domain-containing protein n=1 Tax=Plasmodium chabaudi chabaudi TaxID=31271 RepID=A0A4V0KB20_PLACU|nr:conserved protein, unknown function [Plasmodium chabaudi chabaudi]VTZ70104.1 conserved protein, unknown function [Plasmodium chabaudi chabaudi]|eukprot:XP_737356.2 conserved Plasmodium protein, unknown function [Plasmodium chabaudi chabaudi]
MDTIDKSKRKENEIDHNCKSERKKKNNETDNMRINDGKKNSEINNFPKVENNLDIYGMTNTNKNEINMYNNFGTTGPVSTTNSSGTHLGIKKNNENEDGKKHLGIENKSSYETEDDILLNDETNLSDEEVEEENVREKDLILQRYKHGTSIYIDITSIENSDDRNIKRETPCVVIDFYSECLNKYKSECSFVYYQNYNSISNVIINENVDVGNLNTSTNMLTDNVGSLTTGNNTNYSIEETSSNLIDDQTVNGKNKIIPKMVTNTLLSNNTGINCGPSNLFPYDDFKNFDLQKKKQESLDPLLKCINSLSDRINLQHLVGDPTSYFKLGGGDMYYDINDPFLDDEEMYKELNKTKNEIILTRQIEDEYSVWSADISDDYIEINPNYFFSFYSSKCKYTYESDKEVDEINADRSEESDISDNVNYKNVLNLSSSQFVNENTDDVYIISNDIQSNEKKHDDFIIYSSEEDICESSSDEENGNSEDESDLSEEEIIFNPFAWKKFEKHIPLEYISYFENLEKELDALPGEVDISEIQKIIKIYIHKIFLHVMKKHKKTLKHFNMLLDDFIEIDVKQLRWLTTIINKTSNTLNDIDICRIWFEYIFSYNTKLFVNYEKEFINKIKTSQIFEKNNKLHLNNILKDISAWKVYHDNMEKASKENVDADLATMNGSGKSGSIHCKNSHPNSKELDNKKKIENGINTQEDKYLKNEKNGNDNGGKKMSSSNNLVNNPDLVKRGNEESSSLPNNGSQKVDGSDKMKVSDKTGEREQDGNKGNKANNINNNCKDNSKLVEKYFKKFESISHDILNYIKIFNKQKCFLKDMISAGFDILVEKSNKYFCKFSHIALSDILTSLFNFRYKTNVIIHYEYIEALINFYQDKYKIDIYYDKGKNKKVFLFDTIEMGKLNATFYRNKNMTNDKIILSSIDHDKKENYKIKEMYDLKNNSIGNFKHYGANTNDIVGKNNKYNLTLKNIHTLNNSNNLMNKRKMHESNKHNNTKEINSNMNTKKKNIDNNELNNNQRKGLASARIIIYSDNEIEETSSRCSPIKNNPKNITTLIENITKKKNNNTYDSSHRKSGSNTNMNKQNSSIFNLKKVRDATNSFTKSTITIVSNTSVDNSIKNNMHYNYNSNYIETDRPNIIRFSKQKSIPTNENMFVISDGNNSVLNSSTTFNDKTNLYKKRKIKDAYISSKNNHYDIAKFDKMAEKIKAKHMDDKSSIRRCITVDSSEDNGD